MQKLDEFLFWILCLVDFIVFVTIILQFSHWRWNLSDNNIESSEHFLSPDVVHQFDIINQELLIEQEVPDVSPLHPESSDVLGFLVQSQFQNQEQIV